MHESSHGNQAPTPKQQLVSLLQGDFRPKTAESDKPSDDDNALKSLLRHARSIEGIETRLQTEDNLQLGRSLAELLEPAAVTDSFKAFIVNEVRQAHAWESKVSDAVAPDRLGIVSDDGIFDPSQAQELEGQALRGYAFDIAKKYTVAPTNEEAGNLPSMLVKPGVRPKDFTEAVDRLLSWSDDYQTTYGDDSFEGLEADVYLDAAPKMEVMSGDEAGLTGWAKVTEQLERLRGERDQG